jgi:hypothetical protein
MTAFRGTRLVVAAGRFAGVGRGGTPAAGGFGPVPFCLPAIQAITGCAGVERQWKSGRVWGHALSPLERGRKISPRQ